MTFPLGDGILFCFEKFCDITTADRFVVFLLLLNAPYAGTPRLTI